MPKYIVEVNFFCEGETDTDAEEHVRQCLRTIRESGAILPPHTVSNVEEDWTEGRPTS